MSSRDFRKGKIKTISIIKEILGTCTLCSHRYFCNTDSVYTNWKLTQISPISGMN